MCVVCQKSGGTLVQKPRLESYQRFLDCARKRDSCGDSFYASLMQCLGEMSHLDLERKNATWHAGCYKETTNVTTLHRLKRRYENVLPTGEAPKLPSKGGPPLSTSTEKPSSSGGNEQTSKYHRSSATKFNKELRFFCQEEDKTVTSDQEFQRRQTTERSS